MEASTSRVRRFLGCALPADDEVWSDAQVRTAAVGVFTMMRPRPCPFPMIRVGPATDGGYLVPDDLDGVVACFSPGVSNRKDFEDDLARRFGIRSHLCDYSSDAGQLRTPLRDGQTFLKKWLDVDGTKDAVSLEEWVTDLEPTGDLLLQIDIEGAEYRNLLACPEAILSRFRIIVIEVHRLHLLGDAAVTQGVFEPFFRKLSTMFTPVHAHANNVVSQEQTLLDTGVRIPRTLELTWLRNDRMNSPAKLIAPMLPHPEDIDYNVRRCPPQFLSDEWVVGERSGPSLQKMAAIIQSWSAWMASQPVPEAQALRAKSG